jgi:ribonuclease BN (tRNA processing enzyme)
MPEGMRLAVLGSGSCELRQARSSPAYLLQAGDSAVMLDLGQGAWRRLLDQGVEPASLQGVLLSHHHLDHMSDLLPLLFALNYDPVMNQNARITLLGHRGVAKVMRGLAEVFGDWVRPPEQNLQTVWLEPGGRAQLGGFKISAAAAKHMETSLAFRLEGQGCSLVYLGDSEYVAALADFAQGADLIVAHCAATDANPKPGHIGPSQAGRLAAEADAKTLLLSHFYREVDPLKAVSAAGKQFGGKVFAAEDGLMLDLRPDAGAKLHNP